MDNKLKPPDFRKKKPSSELRVSDELAQLGIELSKDLPTYDVPVDLIEPNLWNPNELADEGFNRLVQEMEETGMIDPIQIVPSEGGRFRIIGGEHRWAGARTLGWETIRCHVLTNEKFTDPKLQKLLTVRLNVIKGKLNPDKFTKLYEEMAETYGAEQLQTLFGFTETDAWKKVIKGIEVAVEQSGIGGKALTDELRKKSRKVKTVDGLSTVLNRLFKKYGNDLQHSFMAFAFGGQQHLYVIANKKVWDALEKIKEMCREDELDINDVLEGAIIDAANRIEK